MTERKTAGLLPYRRGAGGLEVLLVHPGGPYWARKDDGAWSIAKGAVEEGEETLAAARREFEEETGAPVSGEFMPLKPLRQPSGKVIHAFAVQTEFDPGQLRSNTFALEWPPKSGQFRDFPEVDRAAWFGLDEARTKIIKGQAPLIDQLLERLRAAAGDE
jgi:predicted NUDIX family NTP pyrophosphohydrolase